MGSIFKGVTKYHAESNAVRKFCDIIFSLLVVRGWIRL